MRKYIVVIFLMLFCSIICAQKLEKEAKVSLVKNDGKTEYAISFIPEYKINLKAPFNFFLLDESKNQVKKIEWSLFKKDKSGVYRYSSDKNEKFVKYWFVACKYIKDEVVACKTFSETMEIK